jgi:hypothetical protein
VTVPETPDVQELASQLATAIGKYPKGTRVQLVAAIEEMAKMPPEARDQWLAITLGLTPDAVVAARRGAKIAKEKRKYLDGFERANPSDRAKYIYLMDVERLDDALSEAREEARSAHRHAVRASWIGFSVLAITIVVMLVLVGFDRPIPVTLITVVGAALAVFTTRHFFRLHDTAVAEVNRLNDRLLQQSRAMAGLGLPGIPTEPIEADPLA